MKLQYLREGVKSLKEGVEVQYRGLIDKIEDYKESIKEKRLRKMKEEAIYNKIKEEVLKFAESKYGYFTEEDLKMNFGDDAVIRKCIDRMMKRGTLRRQKDGYHIPEIEKKYEKRI